MSALSGNEKAPGDRWNGPEGVVPNPTKENENVDIISESGPVVTDQASATSSVEANEYLRLADVVESEPVALAAGDRVRTVQGDRLPGTEHVTGEVLGVVPTGPFPSHARVIVAVDGGDAPRAFDRHELERLNDDVSTAEVIEPAASAVGWREELVASTPGIACRPDAARAIERVGSVDEARETLARLVPSFQEPDVAVPGWASFSTPFAWIPGDAMWSRQVLRAFEVPGFGSVYVERFEDAAAPGAIVRQVPEVDVVIDAPSSAPADVAALAAAMGQAHELLVELLAADQVDGGAL